jgi:hypothetical protein
MLLTGYESKKALKASIGKALSYQETSMFGEEYKSNGKFCAAHRPQLNGLGGREFFAEIEMHDDVIVAVK